MSLFKKIISSREVERAYNDFMLDFEIQALRLTCAFGIFYMCLFLALDYWRVDGFVYVVFYRGGGTLVILVVYFLSYGRTRTVAYFNLLCLILASTLPTLYYLLDASVVMPVFFLPNSICFFFYGFNACLGYSMRLKIIYSFLFVLSFVLYAFYASPHKGFHTAQVWNIVLNASMSLLIGVLISWFKRLSFIKQERLIESEGKFRQISESINDVFYLYNVEEGRYEFINTNCQAILGASQEFFYQGGQYTRTFVLQEDQQKVFKANQQVEAGVPLEFEFRIVSDGELKWIREKSFPIKDGSGRVAKKSGTCTDITSLKSQELQLLSQKHNLEKLNDTKDKFFSIVAHDLKSPLISLKSFIDLLIHHTARFNKEEILETGRQALTSVENTIKMTDNLITWARLQMNEFKSRPENIYFREIVATILPVYKSVAEKKGIGLNWTFDNGQTVYTDKNQLEFIIRNLLNNAVKFTRRGGQVTLSAQSLHDSFMQISVADNGIGISEERKKKIFSIGNSQTVKGTAGELGTGLGLMLCYEFVKLNHGTIEVSSEEGKGSIFRVTLREQEPND